MFALLMYFLGVLTAERSKQNHASHDNPKAAERDGHSFPDGPITVVSIPPTPTEEEKAQQKKKQRRESISFWVGIATLITLAVYTGFTIATWREVKQSADAAMIAAVSSRTDQRPWIKIWMDKPGPIEPGKTVQATIHIANYGKTPANAIIAHIVISKVLNGASPMFQYPNPHTRVGIGLLYPGMDTDFPVLIFDKATTPTKLVFEQLTKEEVADFRASRLFYVVYGHVRYEGFDHIEHWTNFCDFLTNSVPNNSYTNGPCVDYNHIDENRPR